jgi:hypothetical protein
VFPASYDVLRVSNNEYSPIEHLTIVSTVDVNEVDTLLSYVPQLRSLSLLDLKEDQWNRNTTSVIRLRSMNYLTHLYCQFESSMFTQFKEILLNISIHIQVLCVTVNDSYWESNHINATQWEELIVYHLPDLRVFSIRLQHHWFSNTGNESLDNQIEAIMKPFRSSFWIERRWFFAYCLTNKKSENKITIHSIDPYR